MANAVVTPEGERVGPTANEINASFAEAVASMKAAGATDEQIAEASKSFDPSQVRGPSECDEALVGTGVVSSYTVPSIESLKSSNDSVAKSPGGTSEVSKTSEVVAEGSKSTRKKSS